MDMFISWNAPMNRTMLVAQFVSTLDLDNIRTARELTIQG